VGPTVIISTTLFLWLMRPLDRDGTPAPVKTFTGGQMDLMDTFFHMPNLSNTSVQEKWGAMVAKSVPDTVFQLYTFSRWWANSYPREEQAPRGVVIDREQRAEYIRSLQTEFSNGWGVY
jgi:hypothetical protein